MGLGRPSRIYQHLFCKKGEVTQNLALPLSLSKATFSLISESGRPPCESESTRRKALWRPPSIGKKESERQSGRWRKRFCGCVFSSKARRSLGKIFSASESSVCKALSMCARMRASALPSPSAGKHQAKDKWQIPSAKKSFFSKTASTAFFILSVPLRLSSYLTPRGEKLCRKRPLPIKSNCAEYLIRRSIFFPFMAK